MLRSRHKAKKQKSTHCTTEVVGKVINWNGKLVPMQVLLNGTTMTIILKDFVKQGKASTCNNPKPTQWSIMGGNFITKWIAQIKLTLPDFTDKKTIVWSCQVDEQTKQKDAQYSIIV